MGQVITQCVINDDDGRREKRSKGREKRERDERGRKRRGREKKRREEEIKKKRELGKMMGVRRLITRCVINGG